MATRKSRTPRPLRSTSVDSTPAMLTTSPDEVDRNAAQAPAAIRLASSAPIRLLPSTALGSSSTAASVSPLTSSCGV